MSALRVPVRQRYNVATDSYEMIDRVGRPCAAPSRKPFGSLPMSGGGARMAQARVQPVARFPQSATL